MKKPRFDYFATSEEEERAVKPLHSPLDNMPVIEKPHKIPMTESNTGENGKTESERAESVFLQEEHPPTSDEVLGNSDENTQDKKRNITSNITSSITILPFLEASDIDDLREPATQVQSFRLTDKNKEWLQEVTYRISKEFKRGRITQADVLRIAIKLFEKVYTTNKAEIKKLLEQIK